ncbi:hypothetical protein CALVIDRAFT_568497 [Calocera viscosa TUFC12733]|uniref:Uncharacterized protein n=1 Tax=Calocera viscosa (strain TUFC12733) TaxID=1330018 RepID=A0A167H1K7_CALVF|nr:hypothetical protein CALVIDRAFT_568497 [Calocera viscosa TUFC12733]
MPPARKPPARVIDDDERLHRRQRSKVDIEEEARPDDTSEHSDSCVTPEGGAEETLKNGHAHSPIDAQPDPLQVALFTLPDDVVARIAAAREYKDATRGVYYVTHVPDSLKFGTEYSYDMSNFLVRPDNHAAVVWIIGRVVSAHFKEEDGTWPAQPYISFSPVLKEDLRAATRLSNIYSKPRQDTELNPFGTIYAGRFQKKYNSEKPAAEFQSIYDATCTMQKKKDRKQYEPQIKRNDIVLVEVCVKKRFEADTQDTEKKDRPHKITFQLEAINMLYVAPKVDEEDGVDYGF